MNRINTLIINKISFKDMQDFINLILKFIPVK